MKKISITLSALLLAVVLCAGVSFGQLKSQIDNQAGISQGFLRPAGVSNFFGWFDPNRFSMRQNFSMSYLSGGGNGLSLASYTNSMAYQISDPLRVRFDVTLQGSPFGSSGMYSGSQLSKLFISRAELNYRLGENSFISVQYRQLPYSQWLMSDPFGYSHGYRSASMQLWGDE